MPEIIQQGLWDDSTAGKVLIGSCCQECGAKAFPCRKICSKCSSEKQTQAPMARRGKVLSFTRILIDIPAVDESPYLVGYVLLDDGISIPARLKSFDNNLDVGSAVVFEVGVTGKTAAGEPITGYYFRPERGGEEACQER